MKKILFICSLLILLSSCMTTRQERQEMRRKAKCEKYGCYSGSSDSIIIVRETITIKEDTTVYIHIPGKVVRDSIFVTQDPVTGIVNSKKSILDVDYASSEAWVENGELKHELNQKDSTIAYLIEDALRIIKEIESRESTKVIQLPAERINYVTGWQWFQIWIGRIAVIAILLIFLYLKYKGVFTIIK